MTAMNPTAPADGRRSGQNLRAFGLALALCAPLAACGFGGDDANCVYGEAVEACAARVLGEEAGVAETDAFFARRGFAKDPRVTRAGEGAIHVYERDEARGARTVFMVATFDGEGKLVALQTSMRRN
jgi:hypothetical protein